jgi:hypothetical protein
VIGFLPQNNVLAHVSQKNNVTTFANFAIPTYRSAKKGLVFYEENAIHAFRFTIK